MRAAFLLVILAACGPKKPPEPAPVESEVVVVQKTLDELMSQAVVLLGGDVEGAEAEQATSLMLEATERFPDEARAHYWAANTARHWAPMRLQPVGDHTRHLALYATCVYETLLQLFEAGTLR